MKPKPPAQVKPRTTGTRVLIVDDHPFLRLGMTEALAREPGLSVCGAFASAEEALTAVEKLLPEIVVTDLNLPGKATCATAAELVAYAARWVAAGP